MAINENSGIIINTPNSTGPGQSGPQANDVASRLLSDQILQESQRQNAQLNQKLRYPVLIAGSPKAIQGGSQLLTRPSMVDKSVNPTRMTPSNTPFNNFNGANSKIKPFTRPGTQANPVKNNAVQFQRSAQTTTQTNPGQFQNPSVKSPTSVNSTPVQQPGVTGVWVPPSAQNAQGPYQAQGLVNNPVVTQYVQGGASIDLNTAPMYIEGAFVFTVKPGGNPNNMADRTYLATSGLNGAEWVHQIFENQHWGGIKKPQIVGDFSRADGMQLIQLQNQLRSSTPGEAGRAQRPYNALERKLETALVNDMNTQVQEAVIGKQGMEQAAQSQAHAGLIPAGPQRPVNTEPPVPLQSMDQAFGPEIQQVPYKAQVDGTRYPVKLNNHNPHGSVGDYSVTYYTDANGQSQTRKLNSTNLKDAMQEVQTSIANGQLPNLLGAPAPQAANPTQSAPSPVTQRLAADAPPAVPQPTVNTQTLPTNNQVIVREYAPPAGSNEPSSFTVHPVKNGQPDLSKGYTLPASNLNEAMHLANVALQNGQLHTMLNGASKTMPMNVKGPLSQSSTTLNVNGNTHTIDLQKQLQGGKTFYMAYYPMGNGKQNSVFLDVATEAEAIALLQQKANTPGQLRDISPQPETAQPIGDNAEKVKRIYYDKPASPVVDPDKPIDLNDHSSRIGDRKLDDGLINPDESTATPIGSPFTLNPDTSNGQQVEINTAAPTTPQFTFEPGSITTPGAPSQQSIVNNTPPESLPAKSPITSEVNLNAPAPEAGAPNQIVVKTATVESTEVDTTDDEPNVVQQQIDKVAADLQEKMESFIDHYAAADDYGFTRTRLLPAMLAPVRDLLELDTAEIASNTDGSKRKLTQAEKQSLREGALEFVADRMLEVLSNNDPGVKIENAVKIHVHNAFEAFSKALNSPDFEQDFGIAEESGRHLEDRLGEGREHSHVVRTALYWVFGELYNGMGSQNPNSSFQRLRAEAAELLNDGSFPMLTQELYAKASEAVTKAISIIFSGEYMPDFGDMTKEMQKFYERRMAPNLSNSGVDIQFGVDDPNLSFLDQAKSLADIINSGLNVNIDQVKQVVRHELGVHFQFAHLDAGVKEGAHLIDGMTDAIITRLKLDEVEILPEGGGPKRKLTDHEKKEIFQNEFNYVAQKIISMLDKNKPESEPTKAQFGIASQALDQLGTYIDEPLTDPDSVKRVYQKAVEFMYQNGGDAVQQSYIFTVLQYDAMFRFYNSFGSSDSGSAFQQAANKVKNIIQQSPYSDQYNELSKKLDIIIDKTASLLFSGDHKPDYGVDNSKGEDFYNQHIKPHFLGTQTDAAQKKTTEITNRDAPDAVAKASPPEPVSIQIKKIGDAIEKELSSHFYPGHLNAFQSEGSMLVDGILDVVAELLVLDTAKIQTASGGVRNLNGAEKRQITENVFERVSIRIFNMLNETRLEAPIGREHFDSTRQGLEELRAYIDAGGEKISSKVREALYEGAGTGKERARIISLLQFKLFLEMHAKFGSQSSNSMFQSVTEMVNEAIQESPHRGAYAELYQLTKAISEAVNTRVLSGNHHPNFGLDTLKIKDIYENNIVPHVFGAQNASAQKNNKLNGDSVGAGYSQISSPESLSSQIQQIANMIKQELPNHFYKVHLIGDESEKILFADGLLDVVAELLVLDTAEVSEGGSSGVRGLTNEEKRQITADVFEYISMHILNSLNTVVLDESIKSKHFDSAMEALEELHQKINNNGMFSYFTSGVTGILYGDPSVAYQHGNILKILQYKLFFDMYAGFGSQDSGSMFQAVSTLVDNMLQGSPHREAFEKLYQKMKAITGQSLDFTVSENVVSAYDEDTPKIKEVYERDIKPGVFGAK